MSLRKTFNSIFGRPMTRRMMRAILPDLVWNQEIYGRLVRRYVNKNVRWLDLGCGWRLLGKDLEPIEDDLVTNAGLVIGCDLDLPSLQKHRNIRKLLLGSSDALPFPDGSFDLVTCNMVVEHLETPEVAFREMARVLAPNGYLIIHTPNLLSYTVFLNHTLGKMIPRKMLLRLIEWNEKRAAEDVFRTFYRANTVRALSTLTSKLGLTKESHRVLTSPQPFFAAFAPLAFGQILLMRLTMSRRFSKFGQTILIVFKATSKSPELALSQTHSPVADLSR